MGEATDSSRRVRSAVRHGRAPPPPEVEVEVAMGRRRRLPVVAGYGGRRGWNSGA